MCDFPIYVINTDAEWYRKDHPDDPFGSPFFNHWLPEGYAYMTPDTGKEKDYEKALEVLRLGDILFAYENRVGIVAKGTVEDVLDPLTYETGTMLYPRKGGKVRRVKVLWDTTLSCTVETISAATGVTVRGGNIPLWEVQSQNLLPLFEYLLSASPSERREAKETAKLEQIRSDPGLNEKDRWAFTKARNGQGQFRSNVISIEKKCRVTQIENPAYLRASHIKPWVECNGHEHLDGNNGLMLAPHIDHLFDSGMISFQDDGWMLLSRFLDKEIFRRWSIPVKLNAGHFNATQSSYLAYHRLHVFEKGSAGHKKRRRIALP